MRIVPPKPRGALLAAVASAAFAVAADAAFAKGDRLPDAEIFASSTTTLITDPADPRLEGRDSGVPAAGLEESGSTGELLQELPRVLLLIGASVGRERCFSIRRPLCSVLYGHLRT